MAHFFADSDSSGNIIGFYVDDIHELEQIPVTARPITEEQWQIALANQGKYKMVDNVFTALTAGELEAARLAREAEEAARPVVETDAQKIARLESENTALKAQTATLNLQDTEIWEAIIPLLP